MTKTVLYYTEISLWSCIHCYGDHLYVYPISYLTNICALFCQDNQLNLLPGMQLQIV